MAKSYKNIDAVVKAFDIIRFLSDQKGAAVGPQEISLAVGLPLVTVMNHLTTLENLRVVKVSGRNSYSLGEALAMIWATTVTDLKRERNAINDKLSALTRGCEE